MGVGVANAAGGDADQNVRWTDVRNGNFGVDERFAEFC
jgi:hypothetical protein